MSDWTDEAVCKGLTSVFFAPDEEADGARRKREAHAKQICSQCPVQSECLAAAMTRHERGIWGGTTERERERARRNERRERLIAVRAPRPTRLDAQWSTVEARESLAGYTVRLAISESGETWHGFQWAVFRADSLLFLADNEPDAWLYFHSTVLA